MTGSAPPLLHEAISALADLRPPGRRWIDPAAELRLHATMRNDFLTPRGTPYKWQEMTASLDRAVLGAAVPTVVPVRYRWRRVDVRTGTPRSAAPWREWTFARGQSFRSTLLHTEVAGAPAKANPAGPPPQLDVSYPQLPKSPAVDLLLMLSWDVVAVEMLCTHLTTTPELREVGGRARLERITETWARFQFSDPGVVATFRNAQASAEHLGFGWCAGRPAAVYSLSCLDCVLDVRSGPLRQRGRSSWWATVRVDVETRDVLEAELTEAIIATLTGSDGVPIPVQKRRTVRIWAAAADVPPADPASAEPEPEAAAPAEDGAAQRPDPAALAEAIRLAGRAADYLAWQVASLRDLPQGMSDLALMGFRSVVGTDLAGTYRQVKPLVSGLRAVADGVPGALAGLRATLPEHRRHLEGLLAFGQLAAEGAGRHLAHEHDRRDRTRGHLTEVAADLSALLALLTRLERPAPPEAPHAAAGDRHRATDHEDPEGTS
jgi:hypothetical protein